MKFLLHITLLVLLATCSAFADKAQKLSEIPSITFKLSSKIIKLEKLSDFNATDIIANKDILLVSDHRKIWVLKKGNSKLRELNISTEIQESTWFGPMCADDKGFVIQISSYSDKKMEEERMGIYSFGIGPTPKGFIIAHSLSAFKYIKEMNITSHPERQSTDPDYTRINPTQSCAWHNGVMLLGRDGSFAIADFKKETMQIIEEDELIFNRPVIFADKNYVWIVKDEGGMDGASLDKWSQQTGKWKEERSYWIDNGEDIVSYNAVIRHNGQMIVGTTHGLFSLDEKTGRFTRFYLGQRISSMPTKHLIEQGGYLWAFIDEQWFQIDMEQHTTIKYVDANKNKFANGMFFDGVWILIAPSGVWRYKPSQF